MHPSRSVLAIGIEITRNILMTKIRTKTILLLMILTYSLITGCDVINEYLPIMEPTPIVETNEDPTPVALVTFYVTTPENSPSDEAVLLSVLDEVTGLALNAKRYPMQVTEEGAFVLSLPLPVGTTLKYRYSRRGEILAEEHTTDGRAVRYRIYQVETPGEVHDVVSRWNDTLFEGQTGRISGATVDAASKEPIPGLMITAGGMQVITSGDGSFLLEGLPPGTHNLVVYSLDGAYQSFQQGAMVAKESTTPAPIQLNAAKKVDVTFILNVPEDTPPTVPIRIAGNLRQLGNSFGDLSGGMSTVADWMPQLAALPDGTYGLILSLPVGADIQYKYSLGDGFWNTERGIEGDWVVRQLVIPEEPVRIEDTVETWHASERGPITFDITVPENTPEDETVFIQFNPYGWTEPLPMWNLGGGRWVYILYSPLDILNKFGYRYCRAGLCGEADDVRTPGPFTTGHEIQVSDGTQGVSDLIEAWAWLGYEPETREDLSQMVVEAVRNDGFVAGVEFQEGFNHSWIAKLSDSMEDVSALGANWLVLTPSWTFTRQDTPVLEPVTGRNPMWLDSVEMIRAGKSNDLSVALRPVAQFPVDVDEWWLTAPRDFPWWVSWFDRYKAYIMHHATLAETNGVKTLILGGEWMSPALPGGLLDNGDPSGVPPDADSRYQDLINEIREIFSGQIGWALSYPDDTTEHLGFLEEVDFLYILWSVPLSDDPDPSLSKMQAGTERLFSTDLYELWLSIQVESEVKEMIISLAYPSIEGGTTGCLADPHLECISPDSLNYPAPDLPLLDLDLEVQARVYNAVLAAISHYEWISGVTTRGYYPPTILQDKSTSIHGKPAEDVLNAWFEKFLEAKE